jgi:peroxiredoxin
MSDKSKSETLNLGDVAPKFALKAANRSETIQLEDLLRRGPAIVEFLRGTW